MNEDQILDQPMDEEEKRKDVIRNLAGGGKRFANYIIDVIVIYVLNLTLGAVIGATLGASDSILAGATILGLFMWLLYYWAMESLTGKTVGKYVTRTKIVKEDGSHPQGINVLGRTLARVIPFEAFSFLGSPGKGWHDSLPKIYVIEEK